MDPGPFSEKVIWAGYTRGWGPCYYIWRPDTSGAPSVQAEALQTFFQLEGKIPGLKVEDKTSRHPFCSGAWAIIGLQEEDLPPIDPMILDLLGCSTNEDFLYLLKEV